MLMRGMKLAVILLVGVAFIAYPAMAQEGAARKAEIASIEGLVAVCGPEGVDWKPAKIGTALYQGDRIRTGPMSNADIKFDSALNKETILRIDAESEMTIDKMQLDKKSGRMSTTLDLAIGKVMIKAAHLEGESEFQVTTPTSIVGVRGTGFEVRVTAVE